MKVNEIPEPFYSAFVRCVELGEYCKYAMDALHILGKRANIGYTNIAEVQTVEELVTEWVGETYIKYNGMRLSEAIMFNVSLILYTYAKNMKLEAHLLSFKASCHRMRRGIFGARVNSARGNSYAWTNMNIRWDNKWIHRMLRDEQPIPTEFSKPTYTQMMGRYAR